MRLEWWILILVYIVATGILFFIPKNKVHLAVVAFLFKQFITFLIGLAVVEWGLLEYPIRLFASINRASFTFEYYAFPVLCALFNVRYPTNRSTFIKFTYYATYCSVITLFEHYLEKYTELITYIHWDWYITWITLFISFYLSRLFCRWFFKNEKS
ncbi:CBO0543 family protein [Bacillus sp. REN16]|uniref:CBO0543 family protein n=1 Tax=Bacillus sp. REN16 TaxID=2887296 RepID=UPI002B4BB517|nr:CBO0543 family protein [Bacillus sp. REN16]